MHRRQLLGGLAALAAAPQLRANTDPVVVIGHAGVPRIDVVTVQRLYTGRAIEAGDVAVQVVNLAPGHALRQRFLAGFLQTDDDRYRAYWTVRRHIGKGVPPRELPGVAEVIDFVGRTPGAVGYVDAAALKPGLNVICRL
jgi:hypothetical protein